MTWVHAPATVPNRNCGGRAIRPAELRILQVRSIESQQPHPDGAVVATAISAQPAWAHPREHGSGCPAQCISGARGIGKVAAANYPVGVLKELVALGRPHLPRHQRRNGTGPLPLTNGSASASRGHRCNQAEASVAHLSLPPEAGNVFCVPPNMDCPWQGRWTEVNIIIHLEDVLESLHILYCHCQEAPHLIEGQQQAPC